MLKYLLSMCWVIVTMIRKPIEMIKMKRKTKIPLEVRLTAKHCLCYNKAGWESGAGCSAVSFLVLWSLQLNGSIDAWANAFYGTVLSSHALKMKKENHFTRGSHQSSSFIHSCLCHYKCCVCSFLCTWV